jgi:hypothetical protein
VVLIQRRIIPFARQSSLEITLFSSFVPNVTDGRNGRQDVNDVYPDMYVDGYTYADTEAGAAAPVSSYEDVNYVPAQTVPRHARLRAV